MRRRPPDPSGIQLPSWIFDVDEEDEIDMDTPLLQELDIDISQIYRNILWTLFGPVFYMCGRQSERHSSPSMNTNQQHIDFWGPCLTFSIYSAILWLAQAKDVSWLYIIWSLAATFNHMVCRVWYKGSKLMLHMALLGYSVTPIIPLAAFVLIVRPALTITYSVEAIAVTWASTAAILSYFIVCNVSSEKKHRLTLLVPSVVLMELYLISLMPIKR